MGVRRSIVSSARLEQVEVVLELRRQQALALKSAASLLRAHIDAAESRVLSALRRAAVMN